VKNRKLLY